MNAALRASSISAPLRTIFCGFSANGLKSFGLTAFPFFGSRMRLTARAMSDEVCAQSNLPLPSTISTSSRSVNGSGFRPRMPANS